MVAPPLVNLKGVHWARDGPKFACRVDKCDASYMAKYNLIWHLWVHHNVVMEFGKFRRPSTQKEGPIPSKSHGHECAGLEQLSGPVPSRSHGHECVGLEQIFGPVPS